MTWIIAVLLRPFAALILFACILLPVRYAVIWFVPESRLKRFLLFPIQRKTA
jgi:hypothetical protein